MPVPREWLDRAADALDALTESAREAARARLEAISYADVALARDAAIEVLSRYSLGLSEAAAVISAEMYDAVREESVGERLGADAVPGYDREATDRAVRGMIRDVADGDPPDSFIGKCLDRISWEGQRAFARTTVENGRRDPLKPRFARVPAPGCTCCFCLMLASRGAAYSSEYDAGGNGNHYHAHCRCRVVPCFGGKVDVEGYDPDEIWASIQEDEDYEKFEDYMRRRAKRLVDANWIRDRRRQLAKRGWTQGRIDEEVAPLEEEFRLKYGKDYSDVKRKASKKTIKGAHAVGNEQKPASSLETMDSDRKSMKNIRVKVTHADYGAIKGALNDDNDPYMEKRDAHAALFYEEVRNRNRAIEARAVSHNSGVDESDVSKIIEHIFVKEHQLEKRFGRFDPSYDIAESWRRLREGKNIEKHDMTLLYHELSELKLMSQGMLYDDAHRIAEKEYNYGKESTEFNEGRKNHGIS